MQNEGQGVVLPVGYAFGVGSINVVEAGVPNRGRRGAERLGSPSPGALPRKSQSCLAPHTEAPAQKKYESLTDVAAAEFIADVLVELKMLAQRDKLHFLGYLLDMALQEARSISSR